MKPLLEETKRDVRTQLVTTQRTKDSLIALAGLDKQTLNSFINNLFHIGIQTYAKEYAKKFGFQGTVEEFLDLIINVRDEALDEWYKKFGDEMNEFIKEVKREET